jgi:hypothetical protein
MTHETLQKAKELANKLQELNYALQHAEAGNLTEAILCLNVNTVEYKSLLSDTYEIIKRDIEKLQTEFDSL